MMFRNTVLAFMAATMAPIGAIAAATGQVPIHALSSWRYDDCGLPTDLVQIKSIAVSPDPPVPGKDLTVTVVGTAVEEIADGAYADVTVKLGLIKLLQKTFDVCEEARNANATIQCPVSRGEHSVTHTVTLPKEVPKAKFVVDVRGYSVNDEDMLCLTLFVDFLPKFPHIW